MPKDSLWYQKGKKSEETRKRISLRLKEYFKTHSSPWEGRHFSEKKKKELSELKNEYLKKHPSWAQKKSVAMIKYCRKNSEFMKRVQAISIPYMRKHPEILKRRAESIRKAYKNPELRKRMSRIINAKYESDPSIAEKIDRKVTEWWKEHPNVREERARELKEFFILHPDEFRKKFLNSNNNPFKQHIRTKYGFKVRSEGEKRIADFLFKQGIECVYESEVLFLDNWACVPDFYLPDYDCYIEYYGGFPGSRTKKVLKNRLYSKYSVACIFITPDELNELEGEIVGWLRREFGEGAV